MDRAPSRARSDRKPSTENARPSFDRDRDAARERELREVREREAREREERRREAERQERERERERELERQREADRVRNEKFEMLARREEERERERSRRTNGSDRTEYGNQDPLNGRGREPLQDRLRNGLAPSSRATSQAPSTTDTQPQTRPPSPPPLPTQPTSSGIKRPDPHARISFFDAPNQSLADRLLFSASDGIGGLGEEDPAEAAMANVEEMLEGIEWGFAGGYGLRKKGRTGAADMIEARLMDELMALEKVCSQTRFGSPVDERLA